MLDGDDDLGLLETKYRHALKLHELNNLGEARVIYEELITTNSLIPQILILYGTLLHQQGLNVEAVKFLKKAVQLRPGIPMFYNRLGIAMHVMGESEKAIIAYSRALSIDANLFEANLNICSLLLDLSRNKEALKPAETAVYLNPDSWIARLRLGSILHELDRPIDAIQELKLASLENPLALEPYFQLCLIYVKLENSKDGFCAARKGLVLAPERVEFYVRLQGANLSNKEITSFDLLTWTKRSLIIKGLDSGLWHLVAVEYKNANLISKCLDSCRRAIVLDPSNSEAYNSLSYSFQLMGELEKAFYFARIISVVFPGSAPNNHIIWESLFAVGNKKEAWKYWETRFKNTSAPKRIGLPEKRWHQNNDFTGKVLVCSEQGIGDEILYLSCLPDLMRDQSSIVIECDHRWIRLFERSFPSISIVPSQAKLDNSDEVIYDYKRIVDSYNIESYLLNGDLPLLYRYDLCKNTQLNGYLKPDETRATDFKKILFGLRKKPLIGICWRSAFTEPVPFIYAKIDDLVSFMPNDDCSLISLQYGDFSSEVERIKKDFGITINEIPDLNQIYDLDGVAALISNLDLVIAPSSTVLHLACAIGVPTISTYYPNFKSGTGSDPLFGNCLPILRPDEVFSSSMIAKRTGEVVEYFIKFGRLPSNR